MMCALTTGFVIVDLCRTEFLGISRVVTLLKCNFAWMTVVCHCAVDI